MPTRVLLTLPADDKQLREEIIQQLALRGFRFVSGRETRR